VILRSTIRPRTDDGQLRELEVVCESFEQGRADLASQTPEGWLSLHVIADRDL
jgi:hypothetical protein